MLYMTTGFMYDVLDTLDFTKSIANEDSKSASPAIRACYRNGGTCVLDSTLAIVDDSTDVLDDVDNFMTMSGLTLTVAPTHSRHINVY
jgi:hypothetical protein